MTLLWRTSEHLVILIQLLHECSLCLARREEIPLLLKQLLVKHLNCSCSQVIWRQTFWLVNLDTDDITFSSIAAIHVIGEGRSVLNGYECAVTFNLYPQLPVIHLIYFSFIIIIIKTSILAVTMKSACLYYSLKLL